MDNMIDKQFKTMDTWGLSSDIKKRYTLLIGDKSTEKERIDAFRQAVINRREQKLSG